MRNEETGEYELVVGDKHLQGVFFGGLLLLAVVFGLGYMLGQSSRQSTKLSADTRAANPPAATPDVRSQPVSPAMPTPADTSQAANPETKASPPADAAWAGTTPPVEAQPQPNTQPPRSASELAAPAPKAAESVAGSYWQVSKHCQNVAVVAGEPDTDSLKRAPLSF